MDESIFKPINRCIRCGKCRSVCPVFEQTLLEPDSARGRLFAIDLLDRQATPLYLSFLSKCLLCGACEAGCPNNVPVTDITRRARSAHPIHFLKRLAYENLLTDPKRMKIAGKAARAIQKLISHRVAGDSGLCLRYGIAGWIGNKRFPPVPYRDFFTECGTIQKSSDSAIFTGCTFAYLMPEVGRAALSLLNKTGHRPDVPSEQSCCGLMAYGAGDEKGATLALEKFVREFDSYDRIFVMCASCLTMLKKYGPELIPQSASIFEKVCDVHLFLLEAGLDLENKIGAGDSPVAYHAPCHLRFGLKDDTPKKLLESAGVELVPLPDSCCGFGGSFALTHFALSDDIGRKRATQIQESKARKVTTSCAGCILGLTNSLHSIRPTPEVVHPLCLLAERTPKQATGR